MFGWYTQGSRQAKITFWACFVGWAIDIYDLQVFSFFLPALAVKWGISPAQTGLMGTAALLTSALGGWIAGILSDRLGRVRILLFTICWFTAFGALAGMCRSYEQLLIARSIQGLGFGGEWAVGAALMAEVIDRKNRGRAMGFVQSGFSVGWAAAAIIASVLVAVSPPDMAWRLGFWLGAIPAVAVFVLRLFLTDSEAFRRSARSGTMRAGLGTVFSRDLFPASALAALVVAGLQAGAFAIAIWMPTLLIARHIPVSSMLTNVLVMASGTAAGFAACAYGADRLGRRAALSIMSLGAWLTTIAYMLIGLSPVLAQVMGWLLGFFTIGCFAAIGPLLSELFPTYARTTCMGFSYNIGKTAGALVVAAIGVEAERVGLATAIAVFSTIAYGCALAGLGCLPRRQSFDLDDRRPVPSETNVEVAAI